MTIERTNFARQRQDRLLTMLRAHSSIVVSEAARLLNVSQLTIRRDINALAARGLLIRVHGGATLPESQSVIPGQGAAGQGAGQRQSWSSQQGRASRFTVGMVVPQLGYYWPAIIAGARAAAAEANVRLILRGSSYDLHDDWRQVALLSDMSGLDGLIVAPDVDAAESPAMLRWLDDLPMPVVIADRLPQVTMHSYRLEWVASDHAAGAAMAVDHLYAQGHRRIGLLASETGPVARHLHRGWYDKSRELGLDPDPQLYGHANTFMLPGREALIDIFIEKCRQLKVTALLVHPDPAATALVQHCIDIGIEVPGELAVVAYDDEVAALCQLPVTAVLPPKHHIGRLALELVVARLVEGDRRPPHRVAISPVLNIRASSCVTGDLV